MRERENRTRTTERIIRAAIEVHRALDDLALWSRGMKPVWLSNLPNAALTPGLWYASPIFCPRNSGIMRRLCCKEILIAWDES